MKQRNWLHLARKLVDKYDMDFTLSGMTKTLEEYANAFFGVGVVITTQFPDPFPVSLSGSLLGGSVGQGLAFDNVGKDIWINNLFTTTPPNFTITPNILSGIRYDLLVIEYTQVGDTPIPAPSDPITTVNENLHDDFILTVLAGTTSGYPVQAANQIIIMGLQVPVGATLGNQCTLDSSVIQYAIRDVVKYPILKQEPLAGTVDGSNKVFTTTLTPINNTSALVFLNGLGKGLTTEYTLVDQTVTFDVAPVKGQVPFIWYIVLSQNSINPISGAFDFPTGAIDGSNDTFVLQNLPQDQNSVLVIMDGRVLENTLWNLISGPTQCKIKITDPDSIPHAGQGIFCFELINTSTSGSISGINSVGTGISLFYGLSGRVANLKSLVAGSGITLTQSIDGKTILISAPGTSGGLINHGSPSSPIVVNNLSPVIVPSSDQRQIIYVKTNGGSFNCSIETSGNVLGDELFVQGVDPTDYPILLDGAGTEQNGTANVTNNQSLYYIHNGTNWRESTGREL